MTTMSIHSAGEITNHTVSAANTTRAPTFRKFLPGSISGEDFMCPDSFRNATIDPVKVMDVIEEHGVDMTLMVPTMIGMVLRHPECRPERLASLERALGTAR